MDSKVAKNSTLFLLCSLSIAGSERKTVRLANRLAERGHSICIAYLNGSDALRHEISPEITVVCLGRRGKFSLKALRRLKEVIVQYSVNRLFSVNLYPILYAVLAKWGGRDIRYYALINTTIGFSVKEKLQIYFYAPWLRFADQYVFGCRYQAELWAQKYHLSRNKSSYVYNGVDESYFEPGAGSDNARKLCQQFGVDNQGPTIGTVGRLRPEKSHEVLIGAAAVLKQSYPDLCVIIAGSGAEEQRLKAYSRELNVQDSIIWLGEQLDVRPALSLMDVFTLTSTVAETFSNAALEAMAMAKPLVLSDVAGGARELIEEKRNGYLVEPGSAVDLANCLARLLGDKQMLKSMSYESRARVERMFTIRKMIDDYEILIMGNASNVSSRVGV